MSIQRIWLILGVISTLSIASIAWNYNKRTYLFSECMRNTAKSYPFWDKDSDSISNASAYAHSRCMGGGARDF
jgi:hypothetical protein